MDPAAAPRDGPTTGNSDASRPGLSEPLNVFQTLEEEAADVLTMFRSSRRCRRISCGLHGKDAESTTPKAPKASQKPRKTPTTPTAKSELCALAAERRMGMHAIEAPEVSSIEDVPIAKVCKSLANKLKSNAKNAVKGNAANAKTRPAKHTDAGDKARAAKGTLSGTESDANDKPPKKSSRQQDSNADDDKDMAAAIVASKKQSLEDGKAQKKPAAPTPLSTKMKRKLIDYTITENDACLAMLLFTDDDSVAHGSLVVHGGKPCALRVSLEHLEILCDEMPNLPSSSTEPATGSGVTNVVTVDTD